RHSPSPLNGSLHVCSHRDSARHAAFSAQLCKMLQQAAIAHWSQPALPLVGIPQTDESSAPSSVGGAEPSQPVSRCHASFKTNASSSGTRTTPPAKQNALEVTVSDCHNPFRPTSLASVLQRTSQRPAPNRSNRLPRTWLRPT